MAMARSKNNRHWFYIGITKPFKGLGIRFSFDNATWGTVRYFLFEIDFLWLRAYYMFWYNKIIY